MTAMNVTTKGISRSLYVTGGCVCVVAGAVAGYAVRAWRLTDNAAVTVTDMFVYPIKSCAGVRVSQARVTPRGLDGDRLFMVTDFLGKMQTQRVLPLMATVRPSWSETGDLVLSAPSMRDFILPFVHFDTGRPRKAKVWGHICEDAIDQGDAVADWLAEALKASGLRLVRMPNDHKRMVEAGHLQKSREHVVSFADAYPYLLTTTSSLRLVQEASQIPTLSMARFRPNIVVSGEGLAPFAEDKWQTLSIGTAFFDLPKKCTRCQVPRVNPWLGVLEEKEPTETLKKLHGNMFGMNMVPLDQGGKISVGDTLTVVKEIT